MALNAEHCKSLLREGDFEGLFIEELGWDMLQTRPLTVTIKEDQWRLESIAHKRGMVAYLLKGSIPEASTRKKIETRVAKTSRENIIVFSSENHSRQVWQWVRREPGKPAVARSHEFIAGEKEQKLLEKLERLRFTLEEEESLGLTDVTARAKQALDVENKLTKKFFTEFKKQHDAFLKFIEGIGDIGAKEWYASVMLNRLMFVYFVQRKGFLYSDPGAASGDIDYLRHRLEECQRLQGKDKFHSFYRYFLLRLFHEGLGGKDHSPELRKLIGRVPYLNGGLFEKHLIGNEYPDIQIPDDAFTKIFNFFDRYDWHLDDRPLRKDTDINPDVLGYIFEKYINQKQMGAYYTKEDITEYISKNTVIPFLFDAAKPKCKVAFENDEGPTIWDLLQENPDRYIYPAVRHGVSYNYREGKELDEPLPLPEEIAVGVNPPTLHDKVGEGPVQTLELRKTWNTKAPDEYALPTEIWREVVARRQRYDEVKGKLERGEVRDINDLITLNLDIQTFALDAIQQCEGPYLLWAFWQAIERVTVLDPTCGSGAFLFAALNILEPLYEACLERMGEFVQDQQRKDDDRARSANRGHHKDFRAILDKVDSHPSREYFIYKSIIINNLYGVDIMDEAVEICKLRLFLKLAALVEPDKSHQNLGIEPLPDLDFNIWAGNTLVGYTSLEAVEKAIKSDEQGDKLLLTEEEEQALASIKTRAADLQQAFDAFRRYQTEGDGSVPEEHKRQLRARLKDLDEELNVYIAKEYEVEAKDTRKYEAWKASHQPFHWFVEFYGIMEQGGFDVVIGNPPYVEYSKVRKRYTVTNSYTTLNSGNIYALIYEGSLKVTAEFGRVGLIVPLSLVCTSRTDSIREFVTRYMNWISSFDMRPSSLFEGVAQRLCISLSLKAPLNRTFTAGYQRWSKDERDSLLGLSRYSECHSAARKGIPKIASTHELEICEKAAGVPLSQFEDKDCDPIYVHRIVRYFIKAFSFVPTFVNASGETGKSDDYKPVHVLSRYRAVIASFLNSNLFYYMWRLNGDGFHCGYNDIFTTEFKKQNASSLSEPMESLLSLLEENMKGNSSLKTIKTKAGQITYQEFQSALSKPIIDEIDTVLARHYGFTEEELDFIINYDIKYRMGRELKAGGGDE